MKGVEVRDGEARYIKKVTDATQPFGGTEDRGDARGVLRGISVRGASSLSAAGCWEIVKRLTHAGGILRILCV